MGDIEKLAIQNILGNDYICHFVENDWGKEIRIMKTDGLAFARIYWENDDNDTIYFNMLNVDESIRKQGVGTYLLSAFKNIAKYLLRQILFLWCKKDSWMNDWYCRCGFTYYSDYFQEDNHVWLKMIR
ncbi:GNAT family N-acetyltransferase [Candidatus Dojkabacteria bacterium]|jgi:predicted GNAT family N-acyltransferase|nr:GNAT family N-acetyltransferase [Candidatus Dojkabacteria bacterium]